MATVLVQLMHGSPRLAAKRTSCAELEALAVGVAVARELEATGELDA